MTYRERRRHRRGRGHRKILLAVAVIGICIAIAGLSLAGYVISIAASAPPLASLKPIDQGTSSAVYAIDGPLRLDGAPVAQHQMATLPDGQGGVLEADDAVRIVIIGGEPLDGPRYITWNFVSSRRERILEAGDAWAAQRMGQVPGETEFIPLPGHPFSVQGPDVGSTPV